MPPARSAGRRRRGIAGGLITALQLRDVGCEVQVFERSPVPLEGRGAGIVLHPVTARYLQEHGLLDLAEVSSAARHAQVREERRRGAPRRADRVPVHVVRDAVRRARPRARAVPVPPRSRAAFLEDLTSTTAPPSSVARFADGGDDDIDLLVGADGIRSTVRAADCSPTCSRAMRGTSAGAGPSDDDAPPEACGSLRGRLTYHVGDRTHVLSYEIPRPGRGRPARR